MKNLYMIACVSADGGLGNNGQLLWRFQEDMKFFRLTTINSTVVMGRKTYESIGEPLPKRRNVVLSHSNITDTGVETYHDSVSLTNFLESLPDKKFIIGGASLYQMYLSLAEKLYLTEVNASLPADTFFPKFDKSQYARTFLQSGEQGGYHYDIVEYAKLNP